MPRPTDNPTTSRLTPRSVTWAGVAVNGALAISKVAAGTVFSSQAILADGFHSASDLITDFAVLAGLRASGQPPDSHHLYGHRRIATLVGMFIGVSLLGVASYIAYGAVVSLREPAEAIRPLVPFVMAAISIPLKEFLYQITWRAGRRVGDLSLVANAWHHRSDAFSSVAAGVGLAGALFGGPKWHFLDHVAALVLVGFLLVAAVRIVFSSASELIDRAPPQRVLDELRRAVLQTPGVESFHAMRARQLGGKVAMDIHIQVSPDLTVREGHDIAERVEQSIADGAHGDVEAVVHVEPAKRSDAPDVGA